MPEDRFRVRFFSVRRDVFAIAWAHDRKDYVSGDCRVRALPCDASEAADRTEPMTLEEIRAFVSERIVLLGIEIHDCVGIDLGDRRVDFAEPIPVRNAS